MKSWEEIMDMAERLYRNTHVKVYKDGTEKIKSYVYVPLEDREGHKVVAVLLNDYKLLKEILEVKRSRSRKRRKEMIEKIAERIAELYDEIYRTGTLRELEELERRRRLNALFR